MPKKNKLYRVTKTKWRKPYDWKTRTYGEEWIVESRHIDLRTNPAHVKLALNSQYEHKYSRYEVTFEVADLPEFMPAMFCPEHGMQVMLKVPGIANDLTCIECI